MIYIIYILILTHFSVLLYLTKEFYIKKFRSVLCKANIISYKTKEGKYGLKSYIPIVEYEFNKKQLKEELMFHEESIPKFEEIEILKTGSGIIRNSFKKLYIYIIINILFISLFSTLLILIKT